MSTRLLLGLTFLAMAGLGAGCTRSAARPCATSADCPSGTCVAGFCRTFLADGAVLCLDRDHDGLGLGCVLGPDCDDDDPAQGSVEICDDRDNDCDARADEDIPLDACGMCAPGCEVVRQGADEGVDRPPFTLGPSSRDVSVDVDGSLLLAGELARAVEVAWVASSDGTVARIDTRNLRVAARYRASSDVRVPARGVAIGATGDGFFTTLDGHVVRMRADPATCVDRDGDGTVETSGLDPLPFSSEECRVFSADIPGQPGALSVRITPGPDGELTERLFVGSDFVDGGHTVTIFELDAETGAEIGRVAIDALPESETQGLTANDLEIDARGQLWVVSNYGTLFGAPGATLARMDTSRCPAAAECAVPCDGASGDGCAVQRIFLAGLGTACATLDAEQRLFLGDADAGQIFFYDPTRAFGGRVRTLTPELGLPIHGMTADQRGRLWAAIDGRMVVYDVALLAPEPIARIGEMGLATVLPLVDGLGRGWAISQHGGATVAAVMGSEVGVIGNVVPELGEPAAWCSDGAGAVLRGERGPQGLHLARVDACPEGAPRGSVVWHWLELGTDLPADGFVGIRVRTGTQDSIDAADFILVPAADRVDLAALFGRLRVTPGPILEVELVLRGGLAPPRVRFLDVARSADCAPLS